MTGIVKSQDRLNQKTPVLKQLNSKLKVKFGVRIFNIIIDRCVIE